MLASSYRSLANIDLTGERMKFPHFGIKSLIKILAQARLTDFDNPQDPLDVREPVRRGPGGLLGGIALEEPKDDVCVEAIVHADMTGPRVG
jgi:hypothetical protein